MGVRVQKSYSGTDSMFLSKKFRLRLVKDQKLIRKLPRLGITISFRNGMNKKSVSLTWDNST